MPKGFLPNSDSGLLYWAANFSEKINVDPPALNISPERAAEFAGLTQAYRAAYLTAASLGSRSRADVSRKNEARSALKDAARLLARTVYGCPAVSNEEMILLGLTAAKERPSPSRRLAESPIVSVAGVPGRAVEVQLYDRLSPHSGARPPGASGALVFTWSEEGPAPSNPTKWRFALNTGRRRFSIQFPLDVPPGRRVYVTACWYNARKENGPFADASGAELLGGMMAMSRPAAFAAAA